MRPGDLRARRQTLLSLARLVRVGRLVRAKHVVVDGHLAESLLLVEGQGFDLLHSSEAYCLALRMERWRLLVEQLLLLSR